MKLFVICFLQSNNGLGSQMQLNGYLHAFWLAILMLHKCITLYNRVMTHWLSKEHLAFNAFISVNLSQVTNSSLGKWLIHYLRLFYLWGCWYSNCWAYFIIFPNIFALLLYLSITNITVNTGKPKNTHFSLMDREERTFHFQSARTTVLYDKIKRFDGCVELGLEKYI